MFNISTSTSQGSYQRYTDLFDQINSTTKDASNIHTNDDINVDDDDGIISTQKTWPGYIGTSIQSFLDGNFVVVGAIGVGNDTALPTGGILIYYKRKTDEWKLDINGTLEDYEYELLSGPGNLPFFYGTDNVGFPWEGYSLAVTSGKENINGAIATVYVGGPLNYNFNCDVYELICFPYYNGAVWVLNLQCNNGYYFDTSNGNYTCNICPAGRYTTINKFQVNTAICTACKWPHWAPSGTFTSESDPSPCTRILLTARIPYYKTTGSNYCETNLLFHWR